MTNKTDYLGRYASGGQTKGFITRENVGGTREREAEGTKGSRTTYVEYEVSEGKKGGDEEGKGGRQQGTACTNDDRRRTKREGGAEEKACAVDKQVERFGGGGGNGGSRVEREKAGLGAGYGWLSRAEVVEMEGWWRCGVARKQEFVRERVDGWTSPRRLEWLAFALERRNGRADKRG
ncbi:hypothetical protein BJ322DRAFT_1023020 [Thelephora terrestris]|uniref:Uncharacterized protein n=1 Tax=Thelephora terrestris TaxID=56493 RepID=A0A9P6H8J1_9AGAM|nr:hypothetical protein BJ322DRAFT_1023020 [Thelephora terrestris]